MLVPGLFGSLFLWLVWLLIELDVWLLAFAVQVFAHQVQYRIYALMRVMLAKASESRSILSQDPFEHLGSDSMLIHVPHLIDQLCVCHD